MIVAEQKSIDEIIKALGEDGAKLSVSELPCGGRLGQEAITSALSTFGKVLVAVCVDGACRHIDGGERACKQVERTAAALARAELRGKKVKCVKVSHAMPEILKENIESFLNE